MQANRILLNSLPKSGTNLVQKCIELTGIPYSNRSVAASSNLGRFGRLKHLLRNPRSNEVPVFIGLEAPVAVSPHWLRRYVRGARGYVSGHAAFSVQYRDILRDEGYKVIQVVRHPCAVLASWSNYVVEPGYYWQVAHDAFSRMSLEQRVRAMLYGRSLGGGGPELHYRSFREIWNLIQQWTECADVLTVKYEDLVGSQGGGDDALQRATIRQLMEHIGVDLNDGEVDRIAENLYGGTHTFRVGAVDGWRTFIDDDLQSEVYEQLHDLPVIRRLRYFDTENDRPRPRANVSSLPVGVAANQSEERSLRVLLVTEGYGRSLFGVARAVEDLHKHLEICGAKTQVAALVVESGGDKFKDDSILKLPYWSWIGTFRYSLNQATALEEVIDEFRPDVIHAHGVLVPLQSSAVSCGAKKGIPVLISSHGMLQPWLWKQKGQVYYWLKRLYWNAAMKRVLRHASCVHAITEQEAEVLEKELPGVPQIIIPNAIELNEYSPAQVEPDQDRHLLFLGRIHPVKGIDLLIAAFSALQPARSRLLIAGPDHSAEYTKQLKEMVNQLGMQDRVQFLGGVFGPEKSLLMAKAWVVVVPSYSEVMAMVNLESAAFYTPTITTNMTGLADWEGSGGLLVDPDAAQLTRALDQALSWSLDERLARGRQSRQFVAERYSWDVVGKRWMDAYQQISSGRCI